MAKKPNIMNIASGYYSRQALNDNFEALRDAFDNTLSLDGSTPNAMGADLDMNNNDILNAGSLDTKSLRLEGVLVSSSDLTATGAVLHHDSYTGDGSTTLYNMSYEPMIKDNTQVYIDGVYQNKDSYSVSGTTLTFSGAPPLNAAIEVVVARSLDLQAAVSSSIPAFDTVADLALTEVNSTYVMIAGAVFKQSVSGPAVDSAGTRFSPLTVNPLMFGAVGDGSTDDLVALQACWDFAGANRIPVDLLGKEYNCSESLHTCSHLTVYGNGATLYVTNWPTVGGFVNNVTDDPANRAQTDITLENIIFSGEKLPAPNSVQNSNLCGFGWGANRVRVINCKAIKMQDGNGGGTGGGGFGVEQGGENIHFLGCTVEDCYRAFRVAGIPGSHASTGEPRSASNIVVKDFTVRRCGTAIFAHSAGHDQDDESRVDRFDFVVDGMYVENSGHYPWREFDAATISTVGHQKTGIITLGGAQNILIKNVRIHLDTNYPDAFTDWLGRTGYPTSGDYIGTGLTGKIGAIIWGWGQNCQFQDITLDGAVESWWKCSRPVTFGDVGSAPPTFGDGTVRQFSIDSIRHVWGGACDQAFDAATSIDNSRVSARLTNLTGYTNFNTGVVGPTGTSSLSNVHIGFRTNNGSTQKGNVVQWLNYGNTFPTAQQTDWSLSGYDFGGGYSSAGARAGQSYDPNAGILRTSQDTVSASYHFAFYNPNGLVGSIRSNASATEFLTSSDARLKENFRDFDALSIVNALDPKEYDWVSGGSQHGLIAQELYEVFPNAVAVGDTDEEWEAKTEGERIPWEVDYSKLVPVLLQAVKELSDKLDK